MSGTEYQAGVFIGSLVLMSVSSFVLTVLLERIGAGLSFSEGLLGILTALGADAPEITSSITALSRGQHELGVGVVVGSNIFNLAALLGLSAIVAGLVRVRTAGAIFNGSIALATTFTAAALLLGWISAPLALLLMGVFFIPYVWIVALSPTRIGGLPLPPVVRRFLASAVEDVQEDARQDQQPRRASYVEWLALMPALFAIVAGGTGIVSSAVALSQRLAISQVIAGILVIASLTGIPNAIAALRLAVHGRGSAVETECYNSNTLNLVFGIALPALVTGVGPTPLRTRVALGWLVLMTFVSIALLTKSTGLRRPGGFALVGFYLGFVVLICAWPK